MTLTHSQPHAGGQSDPTDFSIQLPKRNRSRDFIGLSNYVALIFLHLRTGNWISTRLDFQFSNGPVTSDFIFARGC